VISRREKVEKEIEKKRVLGESVGCFSEVGGREEGFSH